MKKIDISKLTEDGLDHVYYKLVDNKVNEILSKKYGELTYLDIIDNLGIKLVTSVTR